MSDKRWTIAVAIFALCYAATFVAIKLSAAQEKDSSYPPTRTWHMALGSGWDTPSIEVVETAGVCLYLSREGIAAVPRTQLPKGAGCQ